MNIKKKWPSEHLRVSSLVLALSNHIPEEPHSWFFKHSSARLCLLYNVVRKLPLEIGEIWALLQSKISAALFLCGIDLSCSNHY